MKVALFIKEVKARLTGDDDTAFAIRNAKKASAAYDQQISAIRTNIVDQEVAVEEAQEALENVKFPKDPIEKGKDFISNIVIAQQNLEREEERLADLEKSLKYFTNLKEESFKEVEDKK